MKIDRKDVLHVARLASLAVEERDLAGLTAQMARIVDFVAQLSRVPAGEEAPPFLAGPDAVTLREDEIGPVPLARPPAAFAPEFAEGFFLVPRLGAMEDQ
jgi:aspartyl-tRNA(Asn)/glutamyl-tRNA(Gln) amidotransferase subunit C